MVARKPDSSFKQINLLEQGFVQRPMAGSASPEEIDQKFETWLDNLLQYHLNEYFDKFFISWIKVLFQALNDEKVKKMLTYLEDLYSRAKKEQSGIVVGNYMDNDIILDPSGLQSEDDLSRLSDLIRKNPILILAMTMSLDELILCILSNNNLLNHLQICWTYIVSQFIEVVKAFENDKAVTKFKIAEALIGSKREDSSWPGFLIVKYKTLAVYYRWNRLTLHSQGQKIDFCTNTVMQDELEEFVNVTLKAAPYAWFNLPMTVGEIKDALVENNSQLSVLKIR